MLNFPVQRKNPQKYLYIQKLGLCRRVYMNDNKLTEIKNNNRNLSLSTLYLQYELYIFLTILNIAH